MEPTTPVISQQQPQVPTQQVNIGGDGSMGVPAGPYRLAMQLTFGAIVAGSFMFLLWVAVVQGRQDRLEDRQTHREAIMDLRADDNRRAGELKGSLDAINAAVNETNRQLAGWRQDIKAKAATAPPPGE